MRLGSAQLGDSQLGSDLAGGGSATPTTDAIVTQTFADVLTIGDGSVRSTQVFADVLKSVDVIRTSHVFADVLTIGDSKIKVSQVFGDVLISLPLGSSEVPTIEISGIDRKDYLRVQTGTLTRRFNTRTTFSCEFEVAQGGEFIPLLNQPILIRTGEFKLFGGLITQVRSRPHPQTNKLTKEIEAVDWSVIFDRRKVTGVFGSQTLGDVVRAVIGTIADDGITTYGVVEGGPTIPRLDYKGHSVNEVLNDLSSMTGYLFYVTPDRDLVFSDFESATAPTDLGRYVGHWRNIEMDESMDNYANKITVRTAHAFPEEREIEIIADGVTRDYFINLDDVFGFFDAPDVFLDGVALSLGRMGFEADPAAFDALYDGPASGIIGIEDAVSLQNGGWGIHWLEIYGKDPPEAGAVLSIKYRTNPQNTFEVEAEDGIAEQAERSGTSGIVERFREEQYASTVATLQAMAEGELETTSKLPKVLTWQTDVVGYTPGQRLDVNLPVFGVNDSFLVEEVASTWVAARNDFFTHRIKACDVDRVYYSTQPLERLIKNARVGPLTQETLITGGKEWVPVTGIGGRSSDGSSGNYMEPSTSTLGSLANSNGPFTISMFVRAYDLEQTNRTLLDMRALFFSGWRVTFGNVPGAVRFESSFGSGDDPAPGSSIKIPNNEDWFHVAWRKDGVGSSKWVKFLNGKKTQISSAKNFTLANNLFYPFLFKGVDASTEFNGAIARVCIWTTAVEDSKIQQMAAGADPVITAPTNLAQYWPLTGFYSPELSSTGGPSLIIHGTIDVVTD